MRFYFLLCLFLLPMCSQAQEQCVRSSKWWKEHERFIPREPRPPIVVRINLVIPQKSDGTKNFEEGDAEIAEIWEKMMKTVNKLYRKLKDPKDEACYTGDDFVPDTYIQFEINELIYVQNDSMWDAANGSGCPRERNWFLNEIDKELLKDPRYDNAINVYLPNGPADEKGLQPDGSEHARPRRPPCSEMPTYRELERSSRINITGQYNKYLFMRYVVPFDTSRNSELRPWEPVIKGWYWNTLAHTLAHELGHSLGLAHHNEYHGRNKCETALMNQRHGKKHNYVQPTEIGKMHRTLRMSNIRDFNKEDVFSPHALLIPDTAHIDIAHKSYEDIVVESGGRLKVSCDLSMPAQGRLIVEPGGTLILDGARISGRGEDGVWGGVVLEKERGCFLKDRAQGQIVYQEGAESTISGAGVEVEKRSKGE